MAELRAKRKKEEEEREQEKKAAAVARKAAVLCFSAQCPSEVSFDGIDGSLGSVEGGSIDRIIRIGFFVSFFLGGESFIGPWGSLVL